VDGLAISSQSPCRFVGENFGIANGIGSYLDFFWAALIFAHRARCAAAIFLRAAADIVFFLGMVTTCGFCPPFARAFSYALRSRSGDCMLGAH
jgi:hypothetical protein